MTWTMSTSFSNSWRDLVYQTVQPNRREHPRYPAQGRISVLLEPTWGNTPATVHGELVDESDGGCRVSHHFGALDIGRKVWLSWGDEYCAAFVVWNCISEERVETGFRFAE